MPRLRVAYGRVSTQRQADAGALQRQEQAVLDAAGADEVLMDVGSGKSTARPGYQRLLELISTGQVSQVLVSDQDRLNRNLQADLELWQLCQEQGTVITDLYGREIEFRTPDGQLLSTMVSALNQHRSRAYGTKTRRGLQASREAGFPVRSKIPFGLTKVRDPRGRTVALALDPRTAPLARQRIEWFLSGKSVMATCRLVTEQHPKDCRVSISGLKDWLVNPMLGGRRCWHQRAEGGFAHVDLEPSFPALLNDAEAEAVRSRLAAGGLVRALAGRKRRMLSGICRCATCGGVLGYRVVGRKTPIQYLRCGHVRCERFTRMVRVDLVFGVLQYALALHAMEILPLLDRPAVDPPGVAVLQQEIEALERISGTAGVVEVKRGEIQRLRTPTSAMPAWCLLAGLRSPLVWMQPDEPLNDWLRLVGVQVTVALGAGVSEARVERVLMGTAAAPEAPLPADQTNILIPGDIGALVLLLQGDERIAAALAGLGF